MIALRSVFAAILALIVLACGAAAQAPTATQAPAPAAEASPAATPALPQVSTDDLTALLATLENDAARADFVRQLKTLIAARTPKPESEEPPGGALVAFFSSAVERTSAELASSWGALAAAPRTLGEAWARLRSFETSADSPRTVGLIALLLALAGAAQFVARRLVARPMAALAARAPERVLMRLPILLVHTALDALPIGAFAAAAYAILPLEDLARGPRLAALVVINAHVLTGLALVLARFVLAPTASTLRVLPASDTVSSFAYRWVRRFAAIGIYGTMLAKATPLFGLARPFDAVAMDVVGLVLAVMAAFLVLNIRRPVAAWIRGRDGGGMARVRALLASGWHGIVLAYIAVAYVVWAAGLKGAFGGFMRGTAWTAVIIAVAAILSAVAGRLLGGAGRDPGAARARRVVLGGIRAAIFIGAFIATLESWRLGALKSLSGDLGRQAGTSLATILGVVFIAVLLWELAGAAMDRRIARAEGTGRHGKYRTAFPIVKNILFVVLAVMVGLTVLSEFGVNITHLLAGAGVIGIAVGLGAQSFAKDILKGLTILLEDSIAVGDWVTVGGRTGEVEELTIGSVRLRDVNGHVYIIPFSEVTTVVNMNKQFGYAILEVGVSYAADVDRAIEAVREVLAEMRADPADGSDIRGDLEMLGVAALADSAVVIRGRARTGPLLQWRVEREFRRRIKLKLDSLGIEIPFPQRAVHIVGEPGGAGLAAKGA
jgi:small conductance mechanosensitive channel